jgi:uncharacterized protein YdeI (YjbR/CyaY-like superfamily)
MSTDPRVDAYIAARAAFAQPILAEIRHRMHAACPQVQETIKWSMPFFTYRGQLLANMAAFKAHAAFGFWQRGAMPTGQEGEAMGQLGKLTSVDDLPSAPDFAAMVADAMALIDSGQKPVRPARAPKPEAAVPPLLAEALAGDAAAAATWHAFTPGCRREYAEWIAEAKRDETRAKRVAETIGWLRAGKKRNWKYENC